MCRNAVKMPADDLPIVDFSILNLKEVKGSEVPPLRESEKLKPLADDVIAALQKFRFCYLKNHGLCVEKAKELFGIAKDVFALPLDVKMGYSRRDDALLHGYATRGIERPKEVTSVERFETFMVCPKMAFFWPEEVPQFKPKSLEVFYEFQELSYRVFDVLGVGLGLEDRGYMRRCHTDDYGELRNSLYHRYPDDFVPKPGQVRFHEHCDLGTVSFIYQDSAGGLEAQSNGSDWMALPHIPGTVILLTGKLMQRWTSDRLKAVLHRVAIPSEQAFRQSDRQSLTFFPFMPAEFEFRCLDGSDTYAPITAKDYSLKKLYEGNAGTD